MKALRIHVEKTVRPIVAHHQSKLRMRKELYAHLMDIYQEELQREGDEAAAIQQAKIRFGDPAELQAELQQSVSRRERYNAWGEKYFQTRTGESDLRFAWRITIISAVAHPLFVGFMLGCMYCIGLMGVAMINLSRLEQAWLFAFPYCILIVFETFAFSWIGLQMSRQFENTQFRPRSILTVVKLSILSVLAMCTGALVLNLAMTRDLATSFQLMSWNWMILAGVSPLAVIALVFLQQWERSLSREWTELELDE